MVPSAVVDLDDERTWPADVTKLVASEADRLLGTTTYTTDLSVTEDHGIVRLLQGYTLRAFHATRLLDHEVTAIEEGGLAVLGTDLIDTRLRNAQSTGALSTDEFRAISAEHLLNELDGRGSEREGKVCLVAGRSVFVEDPGALLPLLSNWGGEAVNFAYEDADPTAARLRTFGRPAIVVAQLDLSVGAVEPYQLDRLLRAFVGNRLGLSGACAELHYGADIPGDRVEAVLLPGMSEYRDLGDLPMA